MTPRRSSVATAPAVRARAAEWVARLDAGLSEAEQAELARWVGADASHAAALAQLSAAWRRLDGPQVHGAAPAAEAALARRAHRRRVRRTMLSGLAACLMFVTTGWWLRSSPAPATVVPAAAPASIVAAPSRVQTLPDGSVVDLHEEAEIAVDFTAAYRRVRLLRGEAHFAVTKDRRRPFVVDANGLEVRAVGTAFAVRLAPTEVEVLVTEGRVAVGRPEGSANSADLIAPDGSVPVVPAGSRVLVRLNVGTEPIAPEIKPVSVAELGERLAWRVVRLDFSGTRLADAVAQVNRHNREQLRIADETLADLRVSGLVIADKVEDFVRLLELSGVSVERRETGEILLRRAP